MPIELVTVNLVGLSGKDSASQKLSSTALREKEAQAQKASRVEQEDG